MEISKVQGPSSHHVCRTNAVVSRSTAKWRVIARALIAASCALVPNLARADWIDVQGLVTEIWTYSTTDTVLVKLSSAGPGPGVCAEATVFAIDGTLPADRRKQLLAMLASAQARESSVVLTYSDSSGCVSWDGVGNAFRGIVRVRTS